MAADTGLPLALVEPAAVLDLRPAARSAPCREDLGWGLPLWVCPRCRRDDVRRHTTGRMRRHKTPLRLRWCRGSGEKPTITLHARGLL